MKSHSKKREGKPNDRWVNYNIPAGKLPISLSVEVQYGMGIKVAEIGTALPIKAVKVFSSGKNIPEVVAIRLYAGESPFVKDNKFIREFKLDGLKKISTGRPVVSMVIDIDMNCNMNIEITDEGSLKHIKARIKNDWIPSSEEIFSMVKTGQDKQMLNTVKANKLRILQVANECLCRVSTEKKGVLKKLDSKRAEKYKNNIKKLKRKLKKVRPDKISMDDEKTFISLVNALNIDPNGE